mgnify:CR=1 FL=1
MAGAGGMAEGLVRSGGASFFGGSALAVCFGAGLAVSEMITSNSLLWKSEKSRRRADHEGEVEPISVQIAGADPAAVSPRARERGRPQLGTLGAGNHFLEADVVEEERDLAVGAEVVALVGGRPVADRDDRRGRLTQRDLEREVGTGEHADAVGAVVGQDVGDDLGHPQHRALLDALRESRAGLGFQLHV